MKILKFAIGFLVVTGVFFYFSTPDPILYNPGILIPEEPVQKNYIVGEKPPIATHGYTINRLASFSIKARILSKQRYYELLDDHADISPYDLVVGWGQMSDQAFLDKIEIDQDSRGSVSRYMGSELPVPKEIMDLHTATLHLIPANRDVLEKLDAVKKGTLIELSGELVEALKSGVDPWRSSLVRNDTGEASYEVVYTDHLATLYVTKPK